MVKRCTRAGDSHWYVGHVGSPDGGWTRLLMFFSESRTNDAGEVVEIFELRAEEVLSPPSRFEVAALPSRIRAAAQERKAPTYAARTTAGDEHAVGR